MIHRGENGHVDFVKLYYGVNALHGCSTIDIMQVNTYAEVQFCLAKYFGYVFKFSLSSVRHHALQIK